MVLATVARILHIVEPELSMELCRNVFVGAQSLITRYHPGGCASLQRLATEKEEDAGRHIVAAGRILATNADQRLICIVMRSFASAINALRIDRDNHCLEVPLCDSIQFRFGAAFFCCRLSLLEDS